MTFSRRGRRATAGALAVCALIASAARAGSSDSLFVRMPDGSVLRTHGPDLQLARMRLPSLGATRESVVCVPRSTEHFEAIVARARNDTERPLRDTIPLFRQAIYDASKRMDDEAQLVDRAVRARYRVACTSTGDVLIHQAVLPTPKGWDSFGTITNDLWALGFHRAKTKYLVFYDDCASYNPSLGICFSGGQGTLDDDDRLIAKNRNNLGGDYAIDFGAPGAQPPSWFVTLHESGHNMGAVQESAPHYSGNGHCWDGFDVMCYSDGGYNSSAYNEASCPRPIRDAALPEQLYPWDCGHDDYFSPAPSPQTYIATHWNIAHRFNRYLDHD